MPKQRDSWRNIEYFLYSISCMSIRKQYLAVSGGNEIERTITIQILIISKYVMKIVQWLQSIDIKRFKKTLFHRRYYFHANMCKIWWISGKGKKITQRNTNRTVFNWLFYIQLKACLCSLLPKTNFSRDTGTLLNLIITSFIILSWFII